VTVNVYQAFVFPWNVNLSFLNVFPLPATLLKEHTTLHILVLSHFILPLPRTPARELNGSNMIDYFSLLFASWKSKVVVFFLFSFFFFPLQSTSCFSFSLVRCTCSSWSYWWPRLIDTGMSTGSRFAVGLIWVTAARSLCVFPTGALVLTLP